MQVFWSEAVSNYNTLFQLALSTLLALPAAGGSIVNLVFFMILSGIIMAEGQKTQLLIQQIVRAKVSFENVDKLLHLKKRQGTEPLGEVSIINFEHVDFSYPGNSTQALQNVSCTLRKGDAVRLTGSNGSGKSTFIKLLTGMYSPQAGEVLVNGKPICTYSRETLNEQILFLNQDEVLLNESVMDYLEMISGETFHMKKAEEALQWAAWDKEDTTIENGGLSLSAGQRKKLLLSKLLLRYEKSSVIILDEVEAGLDRSMVQKYMELLESMFAKRDKIFLMIAHSIDDDLPSMRTMHFEQGRIGER